MIGVEEVASSNLVAPTNKKKTGIRIVSGFPNFCCYHKIYNDSDNHMENGLLKQKR